MHQIPRTAIVVLGLLTTAAHGTTVVYDTLSDTPAFGTPLFNIGISPDSGLSPRSTAMQFTPSETGFLSLIEVALADLWTTNTSWSVAATIYPDVGGLPGQTALESILFTDGTIGFTGTVSFMASGTTWLDPAQKYWLGISPEIDNMYVGWKETTLPTTGLNKARTWAELNGFWFHFLSNNNQGGFRVSVSTVPIPSAIWLFGAALGLLGWMRHKIA